LTSLLIVQLHGLWPINITQVVCFLGTHSQPYPFSCEDISNLQAKKTNKMVG
jgi:hypothetical protein